MTMQQQTLMLDHQSHEAVVVLVVTVVVVVVVVVIGSVSVSVSGSGSSSSSYKGVSHSSINTLIGDTIL